METPVTKIKAILPAELHARLMEDKSMNRKEDGTRFTLQEIIIKRLRRDFETNPNLNPINKAS